MVVFYAYTQRSGFTGIEVKNQALFCDENSNIWCGTVNGLFKFSPAKEKINALEPLTSITQMKVNLKERAMTPGLKLKYTDKNIYFEYHSICITDGEKVRYKVMLVGADNDWQPATFQTYKNYSPLPPGHYTFKVIACNDRGIWNSKPVEYSFSVKPPFYRTWWFILMLIIVATSLIITYINVRERNLKAEKILLEKKVKERTAEVMHKNEELAKKNKDILDSINYAQRIQQAILPSPSFVKCHLPESFVFFRPKDIVSGDFYLLEMAEESVMFAVVDCTGHGVPGAFMSFLGHDGVQRAISEYKLSEPGKVLDKLNDLVQRALQSSDNPDVKDGMDIALCLLDAKTRKLQFAGANNPLYIIRSASQPVLMRNDGPMQPNMELNGYHLYETKGNKQPIGAHINRVPFTTYSFEMLPGDTLYVFSDGFADQFGGPNGRKFLYSNLKTILIEHQQLKLSNQMEAYEKIINQWIGNHEQIDDICLMGVRIT